jgi:hypothetical protein
MGSGFFSAIRSLFCCGGGLDEHTKALLLRKREIETEINGSEKNILSIEEKMRNMRGRESHVLYEG